MTRSVLRFSAACILVVATLFTSGCHKVPDNPAPAPSVKDSGPTYPGYSFQKPGNKGVIVFVHGVLGKAKDTWKNTETGAFWPELVRTDPEFAGFDIYVYQFPTKLFSRSMSVPELAEDLRLELENARIFDHKEVIFICHSMGGLITRDFLQKYQKYAPKVSFLYFFSTPTEGSEISNLAKWLSHNPQFGNMVPISDDSYLANQLLAWLAAQFPIPSYCAYEDQKILGQQIVPMHSAAALCNKPLTPIVADHIQIVKPKSQDDKPHRALQNAFRETRTMLTVEVPAGWTLRQVIESVVQGDTSTADQFRAKYIDCSDSALDDTKIRKGPVSAQSRELVIEKLSSRTEALSSNMRLKATKDEENATYEIRCIP